MKRYEKKHIFMAIAIGFLLLTPVILLILPTTVVNTLYFSTSQLVVYATSKIYLVYGASLLFFSLAIFLIFLLWDKKVVFLASPLCFVLSGVLLFIASLHYISIGTDELSYRPLFTTEEHRYNWDEITSAISYEDEMEMPIKYELTFNNGEQLTLMGNAYVQEYRFYINALIEENGTELEKQLVSAD